MAVDPQKIKVSDSNPFMVGKSDLEYFLDRPRRLEGGGIFLCLSGEAEMMVNMKNCVISRDMQLILLPNDMLTLQCKSVDFQIYYMIFTEALFDEACFRISPDLFDFLKNNFCACIPEEAAANSRNIFRLLEYLYFDTENRFRTKIAINNIQNYFLNSYDKIFRIHKQSAFKETDRQNELFKRFISLVHANCTQTREVTFYANELSISARYLSAIVRKNKNISAKTFIDRSVIQEIKLLLHTTDHTIQEIADRLNFPDQSYLGRYFKKQTGISPKEYRKRH